MRRILGVLREPDAAPDPSPAALRAPMPEGQDMGRLVEQMRQAGLEIAYVRLGATRPLPVGLGLTVYRVAQEALTNVLKHGGPGARVTLLDQWEPRQLILEIADDGRGAASAGGGASGHGLVGMRERVEAFGGALRAGPRPGGGFVVRATIPLPYAGPEEAGDD
jgi:signal transduction histidine kinase